MKKIGLIFLAMAVAIAGAACTKNQRVRYFGGSTEVVLAANEKLVNATWKDEDLWILTRARRSDESVDTYWFREKSSFGMFQGTVVIKEQ